MLDITEQGRVRILRIDRPDRRNALDAETAHQLTVALDAAPDDDQIGCIVLTGTGSAFCAGVDLDYLAAMGRGEADSAPMFGFLEAIATCPLPVVAAVNGAAVGVGLTLCLHLDLVVAARSARFRAPFAEMGVAPEAGSSWLLPQQVGHQLASWLLLSADWIGADEAEQRDLVFEVVDDDALLERAVERAQTIAGHDRAAVMAAKRTLVAWRRNLVTEATQRENEEFSRLFKRG